MSGDGAGGWEVLSSEVVYQGWRTLIVDRLRKPDGGEMEYTWMPGTDAAAVLAFTDDGKVVLTRQYRHPIRQSVLELPAGVVESGETPAEAAARELAEETGYRAGTLELLGSFFPMAGLLSNRCHIFLARDLELGIPAPDEHEVIDVVLMDWQDIHALVLSGEPVDFQLAYAALLHSAQTV